VWQEKRYCGEWKNRLVTAITRSVIKSWHTTISKKHGRFAADRAAALVRCVFNVAIKDQKLTGLANPAAGVTMNYSDPAEYGRARYLKREELPRVFAALDAYADQNQADLFRLCLLTGARKGNVQTMRWQDLNQETLQWRIPGEAHKNGTPVDVPLIPIALAILNRRHAERKSDVWVFPSRKRNPKTPYMTGARPAWMAICKTANIEGVRIHDLRRTMGSWQALTGASLAVIGQSLGHKDAETTQIYARLNDDVVRSSMTKAAAAMIDAGKVGAA
jgi:integrase